MYAVACPRISRGGGSGERLFSRFKNMHFYIAMCKNVGITPNCLSVDLFLLYKFGGGGGERTTSPLSGVCA